MNEQEVQQQVVVKKRNNHEEENSVIVLDSLPYIDHVNEDYEAYALALIEDEMKAGSNQYSKSATTKETTNLSDLIENEIKTLSKLKEENNDKRKIDFITPSRTKRPSSLSLSEKEADISSGAIIDEWTNAVKKAKIEYEYERIRKDILDVEKTTIETTHGDNNNSNGNMFISSLQWQLWNNNILDNIQNNIEKELTSQQSIVNEINFQRQTSQTQSIANELNRLEYKKNDLLNTKYQLSTAILKLNNEINILKKQEQKQTSTSEEKQQI